MTGLLTDPRWPQGRIANALLLVATLVPILFVGRTLTALLGLVAFIALYVPRRSTARTLVPLWTLVIGSIFLPFDVSLIQRPGPAHFARLLMGIPSKEGMVLVHRHEAVLGGCAATGFEPKWVWVW